MQSQSHPALANQIAGAIAWWREAGVDCQFGDDPIDWLPPEAEAPPAPSAPMAQPLARRSEPAPSVRETGPIGGDKALWPQDLAAFDAWWMQEPLLDPAPARSRVPLRGPAGAELMVLVEQPEPTDRDRLLSGPQGALLSRILQAMGIAENAVRFASVLPTAAPLPEWTRLGAAGLAELLGHHLMLAAPRRLITFGHNIPPLSGNDSAQTPNSLHLFNHERGTIPVLRTSGLDSFARAKPKSNFWQLWLDWTTVDSTGV